METQLKAKTDEYKNIFRALFHYFEGYTTPCRILPVSMTDTQNFICWTRNRYRQAAERGKAVIQIPGLAEYGTRDSNTLDGAFDAMYSLASEIEILRLTERVDTLAVTVNTLLAKVKAMERECEIKEKELDALRKDKLIRAGIIVAGATEESDTKTVPT
jgi:hypothetical protein